MWTFNVHKFCLAILRDKVADKEQQGVVNVLAHEELKRESEGNVRYLAGWVLWKEIKACERYVSKCGKLTSVSVKDRVAKEKSLQCILMQFRATIAHLESSSLFPKNQCWMKCWMRLTTHVGSSNICKLMLDEV